ncbi:hypothetical protein HGM15179_004133 [Zosterops borbonicus]|uniref:Uncharacterized protein n=1 Tax=Zosterops borbonicus TaxID=364589 RepID=A0A8K1GSD0_9PASS|nr:hypothetical protein HGM15179_004133 [Zosterops borbonicus]
MNLECVNEESSLPDAAASDEPHPQTVSSICSPVENEIRKTSKDDIAILHCHNQVLKKSQTIMILSIYTSPVHVDFHTKALSQLSQENEIRKTSKDDIAILHCHNQVLKKSQTIMILSIYTSPVHVDFHTKALSQLSQGEDYIG